jgi:hypothetical protein
VIADRRNSPRLASVECADQGVTIMKRGLEFAVSVAMVLAACSAAGAPASDGTAGSESPSSEPATQVPETTPAMSPQISLVPCPSGGTPESPITLTADEALSCDLAAAAAGSGTTIEEEYARYRASEILGEITSRIARERPDMFVGAALSDEPVGPSTLYIKGPADDFVLELVEGSGIEIVIADHQPFSFAELETRSFRVSAALRDLGFLDFGTGVDIRTGRIDALVRIEEGLPAGPADVLAQLPLDLRDWVNLRMTNAATGVDTIPE